jgi:hypothetical protein
MSWCLNQGPSFDTERHQFGKLNGFYQRFNLTQDSNLMTPGKREKVLSNAKTKGSRPAKQPKPVKYSDSIPKTQPEPIYSGFSNTRNKVTTAIKKSGRKLKRRNLI